MSHVGREPAAHRAKLQIEGRVIGLQFCRCQQRVDLHKHIIQAKRSCRTGEQIRQLDPGCQIQVHPCQHLAEKMEVSTRRVRGRQTECSIAQKVLEARIGGQRLQRFVEPVLQIRHRQVEALSVAGVQHQVQAQLLESRIIAARQRHRPKTE